MEQGLQKQPTWFAYECPCVPGKLILHQFECLGFTMGTVNYGDEKDENLLIPTEFIVFEIQCEHCGKTSKTCIRVSEIDWFLDRLTPWVTHDPCMADKILWYWDDGPETD